MRVPNINEAVAADSDEYTQAKAHTLATLDDLRNAIAEDELLLREMQFRHEHVKWPVESGWMHRRLTGEIVITMRLLNPAVEAELMQQLRLGHDALLTLKTGT